MPVYEYGCPDCGCKHELDRSVDDRDLPVVCQSCRKPMRRLYHVHYDVWHCTGAYKIDRNYEGMISDYQKNNGMENPKGRR